MLTNTSSMDQIVISKKHRTIIPKKSEMELVEIFWSSAIESFFSQETIAAVIKKSIKTLEGDRWRGIGIPYRKIGRRVLYRKSDVISWIDGHKLVDNKKNIKERK